ncbi:MAG: CHAT domain-containing protein, partial [Flavobacteriales bacterium]|nr:CHAT domain-containing protein [Flavobacteriales bacterium]
RVVRTPIAGLAEEVRAFNHAIEARNAAEYPVHAHRLYQRLLAPVEPYLRGAELLIVPDGPLHQVSFDALLMRPADAASYVPHLLIQRHAIAYLLSATTAVQFAELAREASGSALALAPGFTRDVKQRYLAQVKDTTAIDRRFLSYVRQPFAVRTAQALGPLLSARVHVGSEASEGRFRKEAAGHGILHLGTHAEMNATDPMYSRLVFSKDGSGVDPDADGYLHAYEIYELDLRAQLAVLTACETGAGRSDGEGVRSIGYGFAYAGCPSLVMSLWNIDEKVSAAIITRFYEHLAAGLPKHLALRQAKLDHLAVAQDELALPYYWAGLVLVGEVEPVDVGGWRRYRWWVMGGVLLIAVAVWWRRR